MQHSCFLVERQIKFKYIMSNYGWNSKVRIKAKVTCIEYLTHARNCA